LRVDAELLHFLEQCHGVLVLVQRVAGALHRLILAALPDQAPEVLRFVFDHPSPSLSCRRASTKRSRPVRSSSTRMARNRRSRVNNSATNDARRVSTSSASNPPGAKTSAASRTRRAVTVMPSDPPNNATVGSQSRTLTGKP